MAKKRIVILGAGISGLALAWFLKQSTQGELEIILIEKSDRVGGWIRTIEKEGFTFDLGAHSCRSQGAGQETLQLIEELGLQEQVTVADPLAYTRYLLQNQKLLQLPRNPLSALYSPLMRGIVPALIRDWRTPRGTASDESIYDFIARRLHPIIADTLIDPLTRGIYAGDIHQLSLRSCFPSLYEWEQQHGSIVRGLLWNKNKKREATPTTPFVERIQRHSLFAFKSGMETLTRALGERLAQNIRLSSPVTALRFHATGVHVHLHEKRIVEADHLYSTLPAHELACILAPEEASLAHILRTIRTTSIAVASIGYKQNVLLKKGFGYLVASKEKEEILGTIWDSSAFPEQNRSQSETRLTVMMGGVHMPNFSDHTQQDFLEIALRSVRRHLHIAIEPHVTNIFLARGAIPQYEVGHLQKLHEIAAQVASISPHFTCLGCSFHGVSVNDCIAQAKQHSSYNETLKAIRQIENGEDLIKSNNVEDLFKKLGI